MENNNIIDLFCGAGGLSKGFEEAGFNVDFAIDMWNDAIETYNRNTPNKIAKCMDIHELDNEYLKSLHNKVIGVIGGPPCQGYSTVGTRDINDPRNHLYLQYCRVVENVNPEFFVIENVKGLLTLGKGAFKEDIISRFSKLGYNVSFKILNAADYGVPQNRYRVFFVGIKNKNFKFPEPLHKLVTTKMALSDLPSLDDTDDYSNEYLSAPQNYFQKKLRGNNNIIYNHQPTRHTEQTKNIISKIPDGGKISDLPEKYWSVRKYNKAFQRMNSEGPSNTIDTGHRNYFHYKENRVPSVRECARIQSFPDDYVFLGSKTSQYKQVGNAVPPLLAFAIANAIKSFLKVKN